MHRIYVSGNDCTNDGCFGLWVATSRADLAKIPGGPREGLVVTIYETGEFEMEATLEWDAALQEWIAREVPGTFRENHERQTLMLAVLKGMQVRRIDTADGYLAVSFNEDGDTGINIYNNYTVRNGSLEELRGAIVIDVVENDDHLTITFNTGASVEMGKRESDRNGPESLIYVAGGNFYVVQ